MSSDILKIDCCLNETRNLNYSWKLNTKNFLQKFLNFISQHIKQNKTTVFFSVMVLPSVF